MSRKSNIKHDSKEKHRQYDNELIRCNKTALSCYAVMNEMFLLWYFILLINHSIPPIAFGYIIVLSVVPQIITAIVYFLHRNSSAMKYVMVVGFNFFYIFILFTSKSQLVFVYSFLISIVILCYNNMKFTIFFAVLNILCNLSYHVKQILLNQIDTDLLLDIFIKIIEIVLFTYFMIVASNIINKTNNEKIKEINKEKNNSERLMKDLIETNNKINKGISDASYKFKQLDDASEKTRKSINNILISNNATTSTIQKQEENTEDTSLSIRKIELLCKDITDNAKETNIDIRELNENIVKLENFVDVSKDGSLAIKNELDTLNNHIIKMLNITNIIDEINSQNSLLALNASIEAARAGQDGLGFANVASEISKLASKIQTSTDEISELTTKFGADIKRLIAKFEELNKNTLRDYNSLYNTKRGCEKVYSHSEEMNEKIETLNENLQKLKETNTLFVNGINIVNNTANDVSNQIKIALAINDENNVLMNQTREIILKLNNEDDN